MNKKLLENKIVFLFIYCMTAVSMFQQRQVYYLNVDVLSDLVWYI